MEGGFVGVAREIWDEISSRKFSERQQKVIKLVIRFSYGCGKKTANIPRLKYFELCGVRIQDAKETIRHLIERHVIIQEELSEYSINKKLSEWDIPFVSGWDEETFKTLLHINLKKVTKSVTDSEFQSYEKCNFPDSDSYEKSNFSENGVTKSVTTELRKVELITTENPSGSKVERVSKDSIKDSIKIKDIIVIKDSVEIIPSQNKNNHKYSYAETVFLLHSQYDQLVNDFDKETVDLYIEKLDEYQTNNPKKVKKDHYKTIRVWIKGDQRKKQSYGQGSSQTNRQRKDQDANDILQKLYEGEFEDE